MKLRVDYIAIALSLLVITFVYYHIIAGKNNTANDYNSHVNSTDIVPSENAEMKEDGKLHWDHMPTYAFNHELNYTQRECFSYEVERVRKAFIILQNSTENKVIFKEVSDAGADILITCYNAKGDETHLTSGEGGYSNRGDTILHGTLNLYTTRNCGTWPDVEIHEILHIFGYDHKNDVSSIMNPIQAKCDLGKIDDDIIKDLIQTYG